MNKPKFSPAHASNECDDAEHYFCFSFRKICDYDLAILLGAGLAYTATVRRCILLVALTVVVTILFGGSGVQARIDRTHQLNAQAYDVPSAIHVAHKASDEKKAPCKRHKVHAHHDCHVCHRHAIIAPASRTRSTFISPKLKLAVANTLADRLAQAAAQASARLILSDSDSQLLRSASAGVIARTGRIRN